VDLERELSRRRLLQAAGGVSVAGLLAACGSDTSDDGGDAAAPSSSAPPASSAPASSAEATTGAASTAADTGSTAPATTAAEAPTTQGTAASGGGVSLQLDPATEKGALEIFDWQGYEDTAGPFWTRYTEGPYGKSNPLKFTFLENDQQALAKSAAGFKTDIAHPCLAFTKNWLDAGLIQPWDVSQIEGFDTINPKLYEASVFDDQVYGIPWDWGYVSLVYRADRVDPKELSWNLLLDERYKGRIGFFTDGVDIIQVGGLINGVADPNKMSSEEIEAAKQTMLKAKKNIRTFWTVQSDAVAEMIAGNLDITYGWPDAWFNVKDGLPPEADVQYLDPVEGRLAWVCGYVLMKDTPRPGLAHEFVECIPTTENAVALMDNYYYGAAGGGTPEALAQVKNKDIISTFGLDDLETALAPPKTWLLQYLPNRAEYVKAAEEVKAG